MKFKKIVLLIAALTTLSLMPTVALAEDTTPADGYNDHDYNVIRAFLEQESGGVKNGIRINPSYDADDPTTWSGVGFTSDTERRLSEIQWYDTEVTGALDLTGCTSLATFICTNAHLTDGRGLTSLDVHGLTSLSTLSCDGNRLTSLNASGCTALTAVNCYSNELTSLDVSGIPTLQSLICYENHLQSISLSGYSAMSHLDCSNNALTSLDLSGCSSMQQLECDHNQLTTLGLSDCTALTNLECQNNQLTSLDLSHCSALGSLNCSNNAIQTLNVVGCSQMLSLQCASNQLAALDLNGINNLMAIECSNNALKLLNASHCTGIQYLKCTGSPTKQIDASVGGAAVSLTAAGNGYVELCYDNIMDHVFFAKAVPESPSVFINWNSSGTEVSTNTSYTLTAGNNYALNAKFDYIVKFDKNGGDAEASPATLFVIPGGKITAPSVAPARAGYIFGGWYKEPACTNAWDFSADTVSGDITLFAKWNALSLDPSNSDGKIYTNGRITLTPSIPGGTWSYDKNYLSLSGNTFTALKAGTTTVTYTLNGQSINYTITIAASSLPSTGQSFAWAWALAAAAVLTFALAFAVRKKRAAE